VKEQGLEGFVAKRRDSRYEPGQLRCLAEDARQPDARVRDRRIHFVRPAFRRPDLRYREGNRLMYAARTRSGFTPAVREQLHQRFLSLETPECPFANLPEARAGRWGEGLTAPNERLPVAQACSGGAV
jgi:ATP-dependent DNA ligase